MERCIYNFQKLPGEFVELPKAGCYCYQNIRLLLAEFAEESVLPESKQAEQFLDKYDFDFLLMTRYYREQQELYFYSRTRSVRALEFLGYLLTESGLVKGDGAYAKGQISLVMLRVQMAEQEIYDTLQYIMYRVEQYFKSTDFIDAATYARTHKAEIKNMKRYAKKREGWSYVKTLDVADSGHSLCIKTLENESGVTITADENTYIMIGCRGEVYDIKKDKFEKTYETSDEPLDIFERMLDYIPAVETIPEGEYISLDELAKICYPLAGSDIYVARLTKRTKVYPVHYEQEYFLGDAGDYLAIRPDDCQDIYIIKKDIFEETYELVE